MQRIILSAVLAALAVSSAPSFADIVTYSVLRPGGSHVDGGTLAAPQHSAA